MRGMLRFQAENLTGYKGDDLSAFVAGVKDGEWLAIMDMPCWPKAFVARWSPYEDGRMTGWFDGIRPPDAVHSIAESADWFAIPN